MRKNLAVGFLSLIFLLPAVSHAARDYGRDAVGDLFGQVYFATKYGEVTIAENVPEGGSDIRNLAFVFGKGINNYLSGEFEYSTNVSADSNYLGEGFDASAETLGVFLAAKSQGDFYFKGRVGYTRVSQDFGDNGGYQNLAGSRNIYGLAVGIGAGMNVGKQGSVEFEYTQYPTRENVRTVDLGPGIGVQEFDLEMDYISLSYVWRVE